MSGSDEKWGLYVMGKRKNFQQFQQTNPKQSVGLILRWILFSFFAITLFGQILVMAESMEAATDRKNIIAFLILLAICLLILNKQRKVYDGRKQLNIYSNIIINKKVNKVNEIARIVGKPRVQVEQEIKALIASGKLKVIYDESTDSVLFLEDESIERHPLFCSQCGGSTTIAGNSGYCEYCGSAISRFKQ